MFGLLVLTGIPLGAGIYYFYNILPEDHFFSIYEAPLVSLNSRNYRFKSMQDFTAARQKLTASLAAHPKSDDPRTHYLLAQLYNDLGNIPQAEKEFRQVLKSANANWAEPIINDGFIRAAQGELAIICYLKQDYAQAKTILDGLGEMHFDYLNAMRDSLAEPERADFHLLLGKAFADQLMLEMSAREVKKALELSHTPQLQLEASNFLKTRLPRNIRDLSPLARYYSFSGEAYENDDQDLTRAASAYERAVQASPDYEWGYNDLAKIYRDLKDFSKAEANAKRAIHLNPDFYNPHLTLGDVALDRRNYPAAIGHFQHAKEIIQRFASQETQHLLANLENQIAYAYECQGQIREAQSHYHLAMLAASEDEAETSSDYDYAQEGLTRTGNARGNHSSNGQSS